LLKLPLFSTKIAARE